MHTAADGLRGAAPVRACVFDPVIFFILLMPFKLVGAGAILRVR